VIVVGNEKGGSGKSTTSMHIAVSLLKAGQRVATIDLGARRCRGRLFAAVGGRRSALFRHEPISAPSRAGRNGPRRRLTGD
jgi:chromosome partitioning protein